MKKILLSLLFLFLSTCNALTFKIAPEVISFNNQTVELAVEGKGSIKELFLRNPLKLLRQVRRSTHPLYGLDECNEDRCALNRLKYPHIRKAFVEEVVQSIKAKYLSKTEKITLLFFSSGNLFTESAIMTHLFNEGYSNLHVICIDLLYETPLAHISEKPSFFSDNNISALKSFLTWISQITKEKTTVSVYSSVLNYYEDYKKNTSFAPNVLVAIDYIEPLRSESETHFLFLKTCVQPLAEIYVLEKIITRALQAHGGKIIKEQSNHRFSSQTYNAQRIIRNVLACYLEQEKTKQECLKEMGISLPHYKKIEQIYENAFSKQIIETKAIQGKRNK